MRACPLYEEDEDEEKEWRRENEEDGRKKRGEHFGSLVPSDWSAG